MKKFAAVLTFLATAFIATEAKLGFGACPTITTTAPYDADMKTLTKVRLLYFDRLPNNLFTLVNLLVLKKYQTLDCLGMDNDSNNVVTNLISQLFSDKAAYDKVNNQYLSGIEFGFKGGITNYDVNRNEFIVSGCLDTSGLGILLAGKLLAGKVPAEAMTAINIATTIFKFLHFQITAVVTDKIDQTAADYTAIEALINKVPGMKVGYMTRLKQDILSCPRGGKLPF